MKKTQKDDSVLANVVKASIAIVFAVVLGVLINSLHFEESDTTGEAFADIAETFKNHVASSHWQWRVQQPTNMIILIHYDSEGNEVNRKPVRMNHNGWPTGDRTEEGCEKIWTVMVAEPLRVDGFRVLTRYYSEPKDSNENYWCRYSLSSGSYFDYYPATGNTTEVIR